MSRVFVQNKLGTLLRKKRVSLGLSQKDFSKALGYPSQFISNWEKGFVRTPFRALPKIEKLLGLKVMYMMDLLLDDQKAEWLASLRSTSTRSGS